MKAGAPGITQSTAETAELLVSGAFREVKAGPLRELPPGETRVLADLAEPPPECLLSTLGITGHGINYRLSRRPVAAVRDSELPHRFES
jgi:hypothetical protein